MEKRIRMSQFDSTPANFDEIRLDSREPRIRRPLLRQYPPPKTTAAAILFLIGGIVMFSVGLSILVSSELQHSNDRGIAVLIVGALMFIPGSYASFVLYGSWRGWEGFDYSMIPSYDD